MKFKAKSKARKEYNMWRDISIIILYKNPNCWRNGRFSYSATTFCSCLQLHYSIFTSGFHPKAYFVQSVNELEGWNDKAKISETMCAQKFDPTILKYKYGNSVDCLKRCMSHTSSSECSLAVGESVFSSVLMTLSRPFTVSQRRYSN